MCNFFSFVATKDGKLHAPFGVDSHCDIIRIEKLDKLANKIGTDGKPDPQVVKCEFTPPDGEMTLDFDKWSFKVDQDIVPDWFTEDEWRPKVVAHLEENTFDEDVDIFTGRAIFVTGNIKEISCHGSVLYLLGTVENISDYASVENICGFATVENIRDSDTVKYIGSSATVENDLRIKT